MGFASLEETGKAVIILKHFNEEEINNKKYIKELKNHEMKIKEAIIMNRYNVKEMLSRTPRKYMREGVLRLESTY